MAGNKAVLALSSVASLMIGAAIGYKVAEKRLEGLFDERLELETQQMKTFYTLHDNGNKKFETPEAAVEALHPDRKVHGWVDPNETIKRTEYHKIAGQYNNVQSSRIVPSDDPEEQHALDSEYDPEGSDLEEGTGMSGHLQQNVFTENSQIQVISAEEFNDNTDYIQNTLTWYAKDGVLTDEHADPIDDIGKVVGHDFQSMFGVKSGDPNVVHVRNHLISLDYEIVLDPSSFAEEIRGEVYEPPIERPSDRIKRGE